MANEKNVFKWLHRFSWTLHNKTFSACMIFKEIFSNAYDLSVTSQYQSLNFDSV